MDKKVTFCEAVVLIEDLPRWRLDKARMLKEVERLFQNCNINNE